MSAALAATDIRPHRLGHRPATLSIDRVSVEIAMRRGIARVVDDVTLEVWPGEIVGLIGESESSR